MDACGEEVRVSDEYPAEVFYRGVLAVAEGSGCEKMELRVDGCGDYQSEYKEGGEEGFCVY